jgi:hypothetical protein
MKQEPPIERSEALRDAPVFGSNPFGGISSQGARPDALAKCASKSVGFARVDQIRCTDFLGKRSCPNESAKLTRARRGDSGQTFALIG